jgi:hypothetical protein
MVHNRILSGAAILGLVGAIGLGLQAQGRQSQVPAPAAPSVNQQRFVMMIPQAQDASLHNFIWVLDTQQGGVSGFRFVQTVQGEKGSAWAIEQIARRGQ